MVSGQSIMPYKLRKMTANQALYAVHFIPFQGYSGLVLSHCSSHCFLIALLIGLLIALLIALLIGLVHNKFINNMLFWLTSAREDTKLQTSFNLPFIQF